MRDGAFNSQFYELMVCADADNNEPVSIIKNIDEELEHEQEENEEQEKPLWSIEDTLFYPLGLINHGSAGKSVFVAWCETYLLSFVFKTSPNTSQTKLAKVRKLTVDDGEEIAEILILELNTLLRMRSGRVYYFSSVKSMHPISWLIGVRAMAATQYGFGVVRYQNNGSLNLEVYRDVPNLGRTEPQLLQSFDITFDDLNIFNCQWQDEHFTLTAQLVNEEHLNFWQNLTGNSSDLVSNQELYFFTISGNIYVLIQDSHAEEVNQGSEDSLQYQIELLSTYASGVECFKILRMRELCLVFLHCGSIDIWFMSNISMRLHRMQHHMGSQFIHFEFAYHNQSFYFTDGAQVAQIQLNYDSTQDKYCVSETYKAISGILACTWVESIQQLICLSCNNIFYCLEFKDLQPSDKTGMTKFENLHALYELTPTKVTMLQMKANALRELTTVPAQLHDAIEEEFKQQQLITMERKACIAKRKLTAELLFTTKPPTESQRDTQLIYAQSSFLLENNTYFAVIRIIIPNSSAIHQTALWQLHIDYNCTAHALTISNEILNQNLCVVVPLSKLTCALLPCFQLSLIAFTTNGTESLGVVLPIDVKTSAETYTNLFLYPKMIPVLSTACRVDDLFARFNNQNTLNSCPDMITSIIHIPSGCKFHSTLDKLSQKSSSTNINTKEWELWFMGSSLQLKCEESKSENLLRVSTSNAVALLYLKLILYYSLDKVKTNGNMNNRHHMDMEQIALQYQSDIERCYGSVTRMGNDYFSSTTLHLEGLKQTYKKMRSSLIRVSM